MRLGIFGGTFDPPHLGHMILASEALNQLRLDRVIWTVTGDPPHKPGYDLSPVEKRLAMVQAAVADNPVFTLSRVEVDRPGPHFAVDTVEILQREHPSAELFYLIGGDSLRDLLSWHEPTRLTSRVAGFGVMHRPVAVFDLVTLEREIPGLTAKVHFIDTPMVEISATQIRQRAGAGQPYRYFVLPQVFHLIEGFRLYHQPAFIPDENLES